MSKIVFFKNAWEYFSRVGGIKIRGLGILLDKKIEKSKNPNFGRNLLIIPPTHPFNMVPVWGPLLVSYV